MDMGIPVDCFALIQNERPSVKLNRNLKTQAISYMAWVFIVFVHF